MKLNVNHLKTIMEIQALRNFSTPSSSPLFDTPFASFLEDEISSLMSNAATNSKTPNPAFELLQNQKPNPTIHKILQQKSYSSNVTSYTDTPNKNSSIQELVVSAARKHDVDPKLINSVIKHESNFNPKAKSHAGATGLMQLMPKTAKWLGVNNIYDPKENIDAGTKYLRMMLDKYDGDLKLSLAAYNAGPGNVDKYKDIPPFKETQAYVKKVTNTFFS